MICHWHADGHNLKEYSGIGRNREIIRMIKGAPEEHWLTKRCATALSKNSRLHLVSPQTP